MEIRKLGATVVVSRELLADMQPDLGSAIRAYQDATPEQRAEWARQAADQRRAEREAAQPVALTLDALLDKLGWAREYAEHLVQPYCTCGADLDGWSYCEHARDLGVAP